MTQPSSTSGGDPRLALTAGFVCYLIWGVMPLAFQAVAHRGASSLEIIAHRTFWSVPLAALFVGLAHQWAQVAEVLRQPKVLALLALSTAVIAANWLIFIWATTHGRVLETSLGYYINPLLNMAAGALLFRERINTLGRTAIGLACIGVALQTLALGHLPIISLGLAVTFLAYGLVRKQVAADAQTGLLIECLMLGLPGALFILWLEQTGRGHFTADPIAAGWLLLCGVATATSLMLFSWAARRMPLSALAFVQFVAPTLSFLIGISQGEALTPVRVASFVFIWAGVAVFTYAAWRRSRPLGV